MKMGFACPCMGEVDPWGNEVLGLVKQLDFLMGVL